MGLSKSKISDEKLLAVLTVTPTVTAAAAALGCGTRTIFRRLESPAFREQYERMQRDALLTASAGLYGRVGAAVDTMAEIMTDGQAGASTRLQAARLLIDAALRVAEVVDIEQRLDALERREMA